MAKSKNQKREKNHKRDALTGKIVNGSEVILVENAVDYVKKLGYRVIPPSMIASVKSLTIVFICLASIILYTNLVSAVEIFEVDFETKASQIGIVIASIIAGVMLWKKMFMFASIITIIIGFVLLNSGVNAIISFIVIAVGIWMIFFEGGKG